MNQDTKRKRRKGRKQKKINKKYRTQWTSNNAKKVGNGKVDTEVEND